MLLLDSAGKDVCDWKVICPTTTSSPLSGLGRIAFVHKEYTDAERWYADLVARFDNTHFAAEAMYWRSVARYKATNDHTVLGKVAEELRTTCPSSGVGEQSDSMAALETKQKKRVMVSSLWTSLRVANPKVASNRQ